MQSLNIATLLWPDMQSLGKLSEIKTHPAKRLGSYVIAEYIFYPVTVVDSDHGVP